MSAHSPAGLTLDKRIVKVYIRVIPAARARVAPVSRVGGGLPDFSHTVWLDQSGPDEVLVLWLDRAPE